MGQDYGKFDSIKHMSLADLVERLILFTNITYSGEEEHKLIEKARKWEPRIRDLIDFNAYYRYLRAELDLKEKRYLERKEPLLFKQQDNII